MHYAALILGKALQPNRGPSAVINKQLVAGATSAGIYQYATSAKYSVKKTAMGLICHWLSLALSPCSVACRGAAQQSAGSLTA